MLNHLKALLNRKSYYMVYIPNEKCDDCEVSFFDNLNLAINFALEVFQESGILNNDEDLDFDLKIFNSLKSNIEKYEYANSCVWGYGIPQIEEIELNSGKLYSLGTEM